MSARAGRGADRSAVGLLAGLIFVIAIGATVLDHAPWFLPWALAGLLLSRATAQITSHRRRVIARRVPILIAAAGAVVAVVVWGGPGLVLNRDARRQLRARPAVVARQHPDHIARRSGHPHRRPRHHRHAHVQPSAAASLYGIAQLSRWHWQRLIVGWSALLSAPLVLWGIAAGLTLTRRRQRRARSDHPPIPPLAQQG